MKGLLIITAILFTQFAHADWAVDFSRRTKQIRKKEYATPTGKQEKESVFDFLFTSGEPIQDIVLLNTDRGFIPSTIRTRQGLQYRIYVVNVNEKEKNVSFVMDAFSEAHATYYGKIKSFVIKPQKVGIYTFLSPETSSQGRLIVYPSKRNNNSVEMRTPASE